MDHARRVWRPAGLSAAAMLICGLLPAGARAQNLLGNIDGLRPELGAAGITLSVNDSENLLGNLAGGVKQGAALQGVTTADLQLDTGKALNLPGGTLNISALQIHGRSLSPYYLDNLQAANGSEADDATRLWELWYDQQIGPVFDLKLGQQSIDNEFIVSQYSGLFVNTMAGWPLIPSEDLYAGGPAYPLSSLGVRGRYTSGGVTVLAGGFDDNPPGGAFSDDPQSADGGGARFNLNTGALFIAELQYANAQAKLPGTYKLGFWYDSGAFPDQALGTDGLSLANPAGNGVPIMHRGNESVYAVVDQTVTQPSSAQSVNLFGRIMAAPANQNLVSFSFNGGVTVTAPFAARANDSAGLDFGLGQVSPRVAELDRASGAKVQNTEEIFELTYQAQATAWLVLQPDFQYVVNPGGGIGLRNEMVAGLRAVTSF